MKTLLADEDEARKFARTFLLPYGKPRLFQCVARKKYTNGGTQLGRGQYILEQRILDFDDEERAEERFIRELRKAEVLAQAGMYTDEKNAPIQIDWMVAYITAYPLDEDDATDAFIAHVLERRKDRRQALRNNKMDASQPIMSKPMKAMQTFLHKSPCRMERLLKLDIDTKDPALLHQLYTAMHEAVVVVAAETRGGYHVVIERGKCCQGLWKFARDINTQIEKAYQWITIEDGTGPMFAIPGTNQGGFTVRLATEQWREALQTAALEVNKEILLTR